MHCNHHFTKGSDSIGILVISIHLPAQVYLRTVEDVAMYPTSSTAQSLRQTLKLLRFFIQYFTSCRKGPVLSGRHRTLQQREECLCSTESEVCKPQGKFQSNAEEKGKVNPFQDRCWALHGGKEGRKSDYKNLERRKKKFKTQSAHYALEWTCPFTCIRAAADPVHANRLQNHNKWTQFCHIPLQVPSLTARFLPHAHLWHAAGLAQSHKPR